MKQAAADSVEQLQPAGAAHSGAHFALTDDLLAGRFFSIDVRGQVTGWNPRAEAAFGWSTHHISGASLFDKLIVGELGFGPDDVEQFFSPESAGAGKRVRVLIAHQGGSQLPVELSIVPIELSKAYELNAFLQDVSTSTASGVASEIGRIREEHADVLKMVADSLDREPGAAAGEEVRLAGALVVFHIDASAGTQVGSASNGADVATPAQNPPAVTTVGDDETARADAERVRAQIDAAHADAEEARAEADAARRERDELQSRIDAGATDAADAAGAEEAADAARREAEEAADAARREAEEAADAARREAEELRAQAEQAATRATEAESTVEQSRAELEEARGETERLRGELSGLRSAADGTQASAEATAAELGEARAELSQARSEAERLGQDLATAQAEFAQAAGERDALRAEVAELRSRVEVAGEIESALAEAREQVASLDQDLTAARDDAQTAQDETAAAHAELDQIRKQAEEAERRAADAERRADEVAADAAAAREGGAAAEAQVAAAREEANAARAELEAARADVEAARADVEAARATSDAANANIEAANGRVAEAEAARDEAVARAERVTAELATAREEATAGRAELEAARADVEAARADAEAARAELQTASATSDAANANIEAANGKVAEAEATRDEAVARAEQVAAELATAREEANAGRAELEAARAELQSASAGSDAANANIEAANGKVAEAEAARDEAVARAEQVAAELATTREEATAAGERADAAAAELATAQAELAGAREEVVAEPAADTGVFESIFDSAAIGMAIKDDGRFTRVNRALCELTGHDADALLALDPVDLVHPDERKAHKATDKSFGKREITSSHAEARLLHADGSDVHVRETASLLDDGRILAQFERAAAEAHVGVEEPPPAPPFVAPEADGPVDANLPVPSDDGTSTALAPADGLVARLRQALLDDGFVLFAQPIIDLHTSEITQYELLLRMREDSGRLLLPDKFLPAASTAGLMEEIDQWVVRKAIALIHAAAVDGKRLMLEVNISPDSLDSEALTATIEAELDATGIDPRLLVIEVTEDAALEKIEDAIKLSKKLRAMGCRFAIDDFGSTFATVKYLKDLAVDYFKLDGDLIVTLPESRTNQLLLNALMDVARGTGTQTIAVYVPDDETLVMLRQYGIGYGQGNRVGRPRPVDEI